MKHFAEVLASRKYDLAQEILALENLFIDRRHTNSIYQEFSSEFLNWKLRNNYIDFDSFFAGTGLLAIVNKCREHGKVALDEYIFYCEYMLNTLMHPALTYHQTSKYIAENILNTLDRLNYKPHESNGVWHIVEKDVLISESADILQDNYDLGEGVYSFSYREMNGNLTGKADILCRLYKYIENITMQAKQYGFSTLLDDIKDLMNKLDIRHTATTKQANVIAGMTFSEYESWIDELFRLSLSLIVLTDYTAKRKDIKELKAELG